MEVKEAREEKEACTVHGADGEARALGKDS